MDASKPKIIVIIPTYMARATILQVLQRVPQSVSRIIVVDDACPQKSGQLVETCGADPRIRVVYHSQNQGVGGAMQTGYRVALAECAGESAVFVKLDSDGQMPPEFVPTLAKPIVSQQADYAKGNRFFSQANLRGMPVVRLLGNAALSFISKLSSGYWSVMDPTNGFTAIHSRILAVLPLGKLSHSYFFESDMLFRLGCLQAVVRDVPMRSLYSGEHSSLKISRILLEFPPKFVKATLKRIFYRYFLRDFGVFSLQLVAGSLVFGFGLFWGAWNWFLSYQSGQTTTTGTVFLAAIPLILGFQLLLSAISLDILAEPRQVLHPSMTTLGMWDESTERQFEHSSVKTQSNPLIDPISVT